MPNPVYFRPSNGFILLAIVLSLAGCDTAKDSAQMSAQAKTPEVNIITLQPQELMLHTQLPGRTSAFRVAEVRPQVGGIVVKRLFREGSDVHAGQTLYQINW